MRILIGNISLEEMQGALEDCQRDDRADPTDKTYRKILAGRETKRGIVIDADPDDLAELWNRADYDVETCGENLTNAYDASERDYWYRRRGDAERLREKVAPFVTITRTSCHEGFIRTAKSKQTSEGAM